ncbi:alpha/beta hydrolase [Glaciibacter superstes]|uniref:alpha/beta hydrolase n=1 Tax=Glaciibacter superstes TaxID=501023 RepID=UPI00047BF85A|nr:alpha/beta hydrolase [Glaciibacter superstes]
MSHTPAKPPYDPELTASLAAMGDLAYISVTLETLPAARASRPTQSVDELLAGRAVDHVEHTVPGQGGEPDVVLSVFTPRGLAAPVPVVYHAHGGGMIMGDRFANIGRVLDWVENLGIVAVSVEYRLAPEAPYPAAVEDCYAGLLWTVEHAADLGIDPERVIIGGGSSGGGITAGLALLLRDRGGPKVAGQWLSSPMLDDRDVTVSSKQYVDGAIWSGRSNDTAWRALLGDDFQTENVSIYAAPARATDLSNLPPAFIDVGSAEVFRDEDVAYASALWAAGVQAELHVWAGAFHGSEMFAQASVSRAAIEARTNWLKRTLAL